MCVVWISPDLRDKHGRKVNLLLLSKRSFHSIKPEIAIPYLLLH